MIDKILKGCINKYVVVYIDDIRIYSENFKDHLKHIKEVLRRIRNSGLTLKLKKCKFGERNIEFLDHEVGRDGLNQIKEILRIYRCQNVHMIPLIKLVKKEEAIGKCNARGHKKSCRKVEWKKEYEETFELLKEKLMNYPILQHPNFEKEYILMTDISGYGLGAVLAQLNEENKEIVIAYASKTLNETQMKYGITELECLAVIWAVQHFHKFLAGRKFRVVTDYAALKGLMNTKVTKGKRARWVMELQQYDFEIVYRAGKENKNVDTLSRLISENDINTKEFYNDKLSD
ncbi:hypothetical protein RclHR1_00060012 [Rhizophagus clarus]|uniref:Reverse transcriptase domain-containing protein n=1 Tax=Rhizophagus clarus TaxID=94130 RepID=A0A2Z6SHI3_9GLOM|nr:hypothetical protein RclHR1_00060012 [Rhizophagus clarus]